MKVKKSIAIKNPTTLRLDMETKKLLNSFKRDNDTFDSLLRRMAKRKSVW